MKNFLICAVSLCVAILITISLATCGNQVDAAQVGVASGLSVPQHDHQSQNQGGALYFASNITSTITASTVASLASIPVSTNDVLMICGGTSVAGAALTSALVELSTTGTGYLKFYDTTSGINSAHYATSAVVAGMQRGSSCQIGQINRAGNIDLISTITMNAGASFVDAEHRLQYMFLIKH